MLKWSESYSHPLADIATWRQTMGALAAIKANTITMPAGRWRRIQWLVMTVGMSKRQRRRLRGRLKGDWRPIIARGAG